MFNPISAVGKIRSLAMLSTSQPNELGSLCHIMLPGIKNGVIALYKCSVMLYLDIKERIDYYNEKTK